MEDAGFGTMFKSYGEGNAGKACEGGRAVRWEWGWLGSEWVGVIVRRDKGTHRNLHVVRALVILLVEDLKVVPVGG